MPSYFGIGDKARGANKIYLGVDGIAREVKKMYLGVDGKARLVYPNNIWKKYNAIATSLYEWDRYSVTFSTTSTVLASASTPRYYYFQVTLEDATGGIPYFTYGNPSYEYNNGSEIVYNSGTGQWTINNPLKTSNTVYGRWASANGDRANFEAIISKPITSWDVSMSPPSDYAGSRGSVTIRNVSTSDILSKGKYVLRVVGGLTFEASLASTIANKGSLLGSVTSTNKNAYPTNDTSGNYWYIYTGFTTQYTQGSYIEDVYDANPNAYPANGKHTDGYWYVKQ